MNTKPRKSLQDLCTMSSRGSDLQRPHRKFLLLAMLELEKTRRSQEKKSACERAANIDQRLAEIEDEQTQLLQQVSPGTSLQSAQRQGGFTLSY